VESVPVNQRWEGYYQFFPAEAEVLGMAPSELGPWLLRYMMKQHSMTNRFNFGQVIPGGQITDRFMEAWAWLEREGFIVRRAQDVSGNDFFVSRAGQEVVQAEDFHAHLTAGLFPDGMDPVVMRAVKPLFARGDYDTAVFRAFKEIEARIRRKDAGLAGLSGVELMNRAFGPNGHLMKGSPAKERASMRDLFTGAFTICRNPSAHEEVKFEDPREVIDMISTANQLLRIVGRIAP
jgi:uncharacterized protein (TIGR02391 family)